MYWEKHVLCQLTEYVQRFFCTVRHALIHMEHLLDGQALVPLDVQPTFCTYIQMGSLAGAQLATSRILETQAHPENVNFVVQKPSF